MGIKIIETGQTVTRDELRDMARLLGWEFIKAVVDTERICLALGGELHADMEEELLEHGSQQSNLWGINLYPDENGEKFVEFDSMINIRPNQGNRSRNVEDAEIRAKILIVIGEFVPA